MSGQTFRGLGVCAGIAFGRVHLVDRRRVAVPRYHVHDKKRAAEADRFEEALRCSEEQFNDLSRQAKEAGLGHAEALLNAHAMILKDSALRDATRGRILEQGQNAEWALRDTIQDIKETFDRLDQEYFRERRSDVIMVGDQIFRNLLGQETELLNYISEDAVIVAHDLSPADTVALARYSAKAFVVETGGRTSHSAILARALNVPCVLNVHGISDVAGTGDEIVVDGGTGEVVLRPSRDVATRFRGIAKMRNRREEALLGERTLPAETTDGVRVRLFGNIEVSEEVAKVIEQGGEGVGLYRTEFLHLERPEITDAEGHFHAYRGVVEALGGREVTIRTIDIGGDKFLRHSDGASAMTSTPASPADSQPPRVRNPALGLRAIRLSLRDIPRFREQLRGILLASAFGKVRLLFPLVTALDELREARAVVEDVRRELSARGGAFDPEVPVGVMIETPAAAWIADLLAKESDFLAIGTNDLMQYALATDRANDDVAYLYRPCHPAVLRILHSVVRAASAQGTPVSICGEMASEPLYIPLLVGLGLRSLSMNARAIPLVKRVVRRISAEKCRDLVESSLDASTAGDVERELRAKLGEWAPDLFEA